MGWKKIKKIDAHVHILPEERRKEILKNYEDHPWVEAKLEQLLSLMDKYNIEKAVLQPVNDSDLYYSMRKTNEFLSAMVNQASDRLIAFADLEIKNAYSLEAAPAELEYAIKELNLKGLKIHPSNLNLAADDLKLVPVLRKAAELEIPVMYHSNPSLQGFYDTCTPEKINKMIKVFPDIDFITAHLGGMRYMDAINAVTWVDISFILPQLVKLNGIDQANRILRMFGVERIIFGTDFPEASYKQYFNILEQMDFSEQEIEQIVYKNISEILEI